MASIDTSYGEWWTISTGVEEVAASLRVGYLGCPVTADGVSKKWRININTI